MEKLLEELMPIIQNVAKKYNFHNEYEDLVSIGTIEAIKCIKASENLPKADLKRRVVTWCRNGILDYVYKKRDISVEDWHFERQDEVDDIALVDLILSVEQRFTPKEKEVFRDLLKGLSQEEIYIKHNIGRQMFYEYRRRIVKIIKEEARNEE